MTEINPTKRQKQAKILRTARKIHRTMGIFLFAVFFIISITGILLGWKKNSGGLILAKTQTGISSNLKEWLPMDSIQTIAKTFIVDSVDNRLDNEIDRFDVRPEKGVIKITFTQHFTGLQIDATTGKVLMIEARNADLIENIHDGTIVDKWLNLQSGLFKLIFTSIAGTSLLLFTITGFWLWYGPTRMKS